jgi:hypothetical protein
MYMGHHIYRAVWVHHVPGAVQLAELPLQPTESNSGILGSTLRHPSNQRTIASWDHPPPEANPPLLACQGITPVSVSTSPL